MARRGLKPGQTTSTSFKPGNSANPGGRPKAAEGWRESLRNDLTLRLKALRVAKGKQTAADKDMIKYLLDQGFGRAPQSIEIGISLSEAIAWFTEVLQDEPKALAKVIAAAKARLPDAPE